MLVISGKDPTVPFEFLEETFNKMPLFVRVPIDWPASRGSTFVRNRKSCAPCPDVIKNVLSAIRLVGYYVTALYICFIKQWERMH